MNIMNKNIKLLTSHGLLIIQGCEGVSFKEDLKFCLVSSYIQFEGTIPLVKLDPCLEARAEWGREILKKLLKHYQVSTIYNTPDGIPMLFPGIWATFRRGTHKEMEAAGCNYEEGCLGLCESEVDPNWIKTTIFVKTTTEYGSPLSEIEQVGILIHEIIHLVDLYRNYKNVSAEEAAPILYAALDVALEEVYFLEGIDVIF